MKIKLQQAEETFGPDQAAASDLLIRIDREQIAVAIMESGHQLRALYEFSAGPEDLSAILAENPLLAYPYRSVRVSVATRKFTFIPEDAFSNDRVTEYSRFLQPEQASDLVFTSHRGFGIRNLAAVGTALQKSLQSCFPGASVTSQIDPFLAGIHRRAAGQESFWHFNAGNGCLEAALVRNGRLVFCNTFDTPGPDDLNYFLLLLLKEFPDAAKERVVVSGTLERGDPFFKRLKKYFRDIETADMAWVHRSETFSRLPVHHYFTLLNLAGCE